MALATLPLVTIVDPEFGNIDATLTYDNVAMKAVSVTVANPTNYSVTGTVTRAADDRTFVRVFGPGTTTLNLPTQGNNSVPVTFNSRGNLDGYDFSLG